MPNRGKLVIASMLTVGLLAAGFAWWYNFRQGRQVLKFWGAETAQRIRLADQCEFLSLSPAPPADHSALNIDGRPWSVGQRIDLTGARGLVHLRQALISDPSYRWDVPPAPPESATWRYALRFRDAGGQTLLVFDLERGQVLDPSGDRRADIQPIAAGLRTYFDELRSSGSGSE